MESPLLTERMKLFAKPERWLFICSANYIRSPTAEHVARLMGLFADSCGIDPEAGKRVTLARLAWATVIVCMEPRHKLEAMKHVRPPIPTPQQHWMVWDLADRADWSYCHPELMATCRNLIEDTATAVEMTRIGFRRGREKLQLQFANHYHARTEG